MTEYGIVKGSRHFKAVHCTRTIRKARVEPDLCGRFFFQAEDGIRYLVRSRGLGDVYERRADRRHF